MCLPRVSLHCSLLEFHDKLKPLTLSLPNVAKGKFRPNFIFKNFEKHIASCESTGRELSLEWSHHRISSTDSEVRVILQNSIKHSGSERVNNIKLTSWQLPQNGELFAVYK